MSYSFDVDSRIVQLTTTDDLDLLNLYSRWKDEVLSTIPNAPQFMRVIKEPLIGSVFIGPYYFIMNNWQIRPFDANYVLEVSGALIKDASMTVDQYKVDDLTNTVTINQITAVDVQTAETRAALTDAQAAELSTAAAQSVVAAVQAAIAATDATLARKHLTNRDRIDPAARTLTRYDDDQTTPLTVFNLKDSAGAASTEEIYEKDPQ